MGGYGSKISATRHGQAAAETAATVASASAAAADVAEVARATEYDEEEAGDNQGAPSNPTHNWVCSAVDDGKLMGMAADGAIPPSSEAALTWQSAFGDPSPTL